jgi:hypothetical protein
MRIINKLEAVFFEVSYRMGRKGSVTYSATRDQFIGSEVAILPEYEECMNETMKYSDSPGPTVDEVVTSS